MLFPLSYMLIEKVIVEVDKESGFCPGVVSAIQKAEVELQTRPKLYCLGDIVHNSMDVKRLEDQGLVTISREELSKLHDTKVLLRAPALGRKQLVEEKGAVLLGQMTVPEETCEIHAKGDQDGRQLVEKGAFLTKDAPQFETEHRDECDGESGADEHGQGEEGDRDMKIPSLPTFEVFEIIPEAYDTQR